MIESFNKTIDVWIEAVQTYSYEQLLMQPDTNNWSLGQVCTHLLNDTNWFLEQIKICLLNDDNANEIMLPVAQTFFINNSFPDEKLTNPANAHMQQPTSKEALLQSFLNLKNDVNIEAEKILSSITKGKTKHPGLGYFNATEWLHFSEMHLRHHLKQKKFIEDYLNKIV